MDMLEGETHIRDYALERLMMLSDGVFAIAMTLLALDVRPPEHWVHTIAGLLEALAVPFQAFFWSFFSIASFWITHRRLFGQFRRADAALTFLNLLLLGEVTLIPVATRVLTELTFSQDALRLYLALFALIGLTNTAAWIYAWSRPAMIFERVGAGRGLAVAVIQLVVPLGMTTLGVLSTQQGLHVLPLFMPPLILGATLLRSLGRTFDARRASQAKSRPPLPAPPIQGQLTD